MEKKRVLDVRLPKEEQNKKEFVDAIKSKKFKYQNVQYPDGKVRFMYGNDPKALQDFAKLSGLKILKVIEL